MVFLVSSDPLAIASSGNVTPIVNNTNNLLVNKLINYCFGHLSHILKKARDNGIDKKKNHRVWMPVNTGSNRV